MNTVLGLKAEIRSTQEEIKRLEGRLKSAKARVNKNPSLIGEIEFILTDRRLYLEKIEGRLKGLLGISG